MLHFFAWLLMLLDASLSCFAANSTGCRALPILGFADIAVADIADFLGPI